MNTSSAIIRRARRQALVTQHIVALTRRMRELRSLDADEARHLARRYARALGLPPPSDATLDYLRSEDAADAPVEELDMLFADDANVAMKSIIARACRRAG